jgi:hypothetical protein
MALTVAQVVYSGDPVAEAADLTGRMVNGQKGAQSSRADRRGSYYAARGAPLVASDGPTG